MDSLTAPAVKTESVESIGSYIKRCREAKNLSQRELAKLSDVSNTEISRIESGIRQRPDLNILGRLTAHLDIPMQDLLKNTGYADALNELIAEREAINPVTELNSYVDMRLKALEAAITLWGQTDEMGRCYLSGTLFLSFGIAKGNVIRMNKTCINKSNRDDWPTALWFAENKIILNRLKNQQTAPKLIGGGQVFIEGATVWSYAAPDKPYHVPRLVVFSSAIEGLTFDDIPDLKEGDK